MAAVIFDVDGVLLDSMACYRRAWASWGAAHGIAIDTIWSIAPGRRPADIISTVSPRLHLGTELPAFLEHLNRALAWVKPMPGAASLLAALPTGSWAVATSGLRAQLQAAFRTSGLRLPAVTVTAEDVDAGKPAPDCYLLAARRLGVAPADCLAVEDAPSGIAAARSAGMACVALVTTHRRTVLLGADQIFASLGEAAGVLLAHVGD